MAYYDAEVKGVDFEKESAVSAINRWVDAKTLGKIPVLLDQIPPEAVMYLINAMHFKSLWKQQFETGSTQKSMFKTHEHEVMADMMYGKKMPMLHFRDSELELTELAYGNGQFCMTILMPAADPEDFLSQLTSESLNQYLNLADTVTMNIHMLKFSLAFEMKLNDVLKAMGLKRAFADNAELGGLFQQKLSVKVSEVLHKAVIEVDESGTEAAAVTSVGIELTSMPMEVDLNRPFIFMIRERHTQAILFSGILRNPLR
jgi:serpin B